MRHSAKFSVLLQIIHYYIWSLPNPCQYCSMVWTFVYLMLLHLILFRQDCWWTYLRPALTTLYKNAVLCSMSSPFRIHYDKITWRKSSNEPPNQPFDKTWFHWHNSRLFISSTISYIIVTSDRNYVISTGWYELNTHMYSLYNILQQSVTITDMPTY